ncbi:TPA: hypothetical protein N0F65_003165 [Lagenidium giganteum]|uniref:Uncharacterized protein n=1 Tax=Lagenidium giganteum TaxID=4803 RepID=A0AAV2Z8A9_9STRA|nr:TPA: hypothetical protein N0F65_003165 [Lagenidium giganteum]
MREQNEQLLALIEANGDVRVAQTLLQQRIIVAGFRRALDQIENLGKPLDDQWALVKTWRTIYRSHTLQVLKSLAAGAPGTPAVSTPQ